MVLEINNEPSTLQTGTVGTLKSDRTTWVVIMGLSSAAVVKQGSRDNWHLSQCQCGEMTLRIQRQPLRTQMQPRERGRGMED